MTEREHRVPSERRHAIGPVAGEMTAPAAELGDVSRAAEPRRLAPADHTLVPGLLAPVAAAYAEHGVPGFGAALYGPRWDPSMGSREPAATAPGQGPVLVTVGGDSPAPRHAAATALRERFEYPVRVIPGASQFVPTEQPEAFAGLIREAHFAARHRLFIRPR